MSGVDNRVVSIRFDNASFQQKVNETLVSLEKLRISLDFKAVKSGLDSTAIITKLTAVGTAAENAKVKVDALGKAGESSQAVTNITAIGTASEGTRTKFETLGGVLDTLKLKMGFQEVKPIGDLGAPAAATHVSGLVGALDKLKGALSFGGVKSLGDLGAPVAAGHINTLGASVEGVSAKFLALTTIAVTSLSTITRHAIDTGTQFVKSLSVDPITQGFGEFELKMGSIQTIMAGSGASLEVVNQKLADLNAYSDKTIYSFKDMTSNIGKFTNAGVNLDDSVAAIQGVANVAALSGANAEEASRAMYNFSQALSSGSVKLMDWKSIELANMGTKEFKQQLIDSAEAMGTLTKQGDHWVTSTGTSVTATKGFNESLTDEWLTAEALTTTLGKYSDATTDIGKRATAAATDVKTFSQMIDTMKESVGSGWAQTFELVFGDFEEGKKLWTGINDWFSETVGKSAQARNDVIQAWKGLGGRDVLLQGLKDALKGLGSVLKPIQEAFRDIFPKKTALELAQLTETFANFAKHLTVSGETATKIKSAFSGLFSIFKIGFAVIKGVVGVIASFVGSFTSAGGGALGLAANLGDAITKFKEFLIEGGGLSAFFEKVTQVVLKVSAAIRGFGSFIADIFGVFKGAPKAEGSFTTLGNRINQFGLAVSRVGGVWDKFKEKIQSIVGVFSKIGQYIKDFFSKFGESLSDGFQSTDFDKVLSALNVGLLGGIVVLLRKFFKEGLKIDLSGGVIDKVKGALGELTNTLQTMQTTLKAKALMNIAIAMGVLAAAVLVLSFIDSSKLTKALTAMSVGFGELVGSMILMNKIGTGAKDSGKLAIMAAGMIALAAAMVVMSLAVKVLSTMKPEELAKGLGAVGALLLGMAGFAKLVSGNTSGLVRAGVAMIGVAIAMGLLALAVKAFSMMDWDEMLQGLAGVAIGLGVIALGMNLMPKGMITKTAGLIGVAIALGILSLAVRSFATMSWGDMVKGLVGVGGGLLIIATAMGLMPLSMVFTAGALVAVSIALNLMALAIKSIGGMDWGELGKGLLGMAVALGILALAAHAMNGAVAGAIAMGIMSAALFVLGGVITTLGDLSIMQLVTALGAMAAMFGVIGLAALLLAPVIPAMLGLALAIGAVGAAIALMGLGANLMAEAFHTLASTGEKGVKVVKKIMEETIASIPNLLAAFAKGIVNLGEEILKAIPKLIKLLASALSELFKGIIKIAPELFEMVKTLLLGLLQLMRDMAPDFFETGFFILMEFLRGLRDNIGEIATTVSDILINFMDALALKVPELIDSAYNLLVAVVKGVAAKLVGLHLLLLEKGKDFLGGLWQGVKDKAVELGIWFTELPGKLRDALGDLVETLKTKGNDFLKGFALGVYLKYEEIKAWFIALPGKIRDTIGDVLETLKQKGMDLLSGLKQGAIDKYEDVKAWFVALPGKIRDALVNLLETLKTKGADLMSGLKQGAIDKFEEVKTWFANLPSRVADAVGDMSKRLLSVGKDVIGGLIEGMQSKWEEAKSWLSGLNPASWFNDINPYKGHAIVNLFTTGDAVFQGLLNGMKSGWDDNKKWLKSIDPSKSIDNKKWASGIKNVAEMFGSVVDIQPVITPVLDMSQVRSEMAQSAGLWGTKPIAGVSASITPKVSWNQAKEIAHTRDIVNDHEIGPGEIGSKVVNFTQNNYSPEALSTGDIYRNTKSQIAVVKKELEIA